MCSHDGEEPRDRLLNSSGLSIRRKLHIPNLRRFALAIALLSLDSPDRGSSRLKMFIRVFSWDPFVLSRPKSHRIDRATGPAVPYAAPVWV